MLCRNLLQRSITAENDKAETLIPLTDSLYVTAKLKHTNTVVVELGTGYYVEKVCLVD